ncbi:hypothetical protein [Actinoallomurus acanthiterrae]
MAESTSSGTFPPLTRPTQAESAPSVAAFSVGRPAADTEDSAEASWDSSPADV